MRPSGLAVGALGEVGRAPCPGGHAKHRLGPSSLPRACRSKAALRLRFEVCPELRGHVELLPETGYIQALSSCTVQLKFLPR